MSAKEKYDLIIIGAGPAGIGAAVQAKLCGLKAVLVREGNAGGRLGLARRVENFPWPSAGRPSSGSVVCQRFGKWLARCRIPSVKDTIERVDQSRGLFKAGGRSGKTYQSRTVVVATGVRPKTWNVPGSGGGAERIVDNWRLIPRPRGACVAVIGGGEVAFDQACSLAERGAEVVLLMRGARPRAHPGLVAEAARLGVKVVDRMPVKSVNCDQRGALLTASGGRRYCCDYVLPAVGHRPRLPELGRAAKGRLGRGLWLAGDVREKLCRQAAVAFGDGVRAAMLAREHVRRAKR